MSINANELKIYLSGGDTNNNPNNSLGGAISTTEVVDNTLNNLFDKVSAEESANGDTEYRCFYIKNTNSTLTAVDLKVYIDTQTPADDVIAIGLGTSNIDGVEQTIADENTTPTGVSFIESTGINNALTIGDLPAGSHKAIWVRRTVPSNTSAYTNNSFILSFRCETL